MVLSGAENSILRFDGGLVIIEADCTDFQKLSYKIKVFVQFEKYMLIFPVLYVILTKVYMPSIDRPSGQSQYVQYKEDYILARVIVDPEKCIGCTSCVRACPVPAANRAEDNVIHVNDDECIRCGECIKSCPHGARDYIDDIDEFLQLIKKQKVSLIVAPAIKSAFDGYWRHALQWLKDKGVHEIYDASFGADICTFMHIEFLKRHPGEKVVSQPCAAIVNYAEKHLPSLLSHLSPVQSPMMCSAIYIRKYLHNDDVLVGLSPCIAKGVEFANTGVVSMNVTFRKLNEYFQKANINFAPGYSKFEFSATRGFDGAFYPLPGGLKECLRAYEPELNVITSEGAGKVYDDLETYIKAPKAKRPVVYDVLSCEFGCNSGAGAREDFNSFNTYDVMKNAKAWASRNKKSLRFHKKIFKQLILEDFLRGYTDRSTGSNIADIELEEVYISMGKHTKAERNINCHACGYKSCRHMAMSIYMGNNTPNNCMVFEKQNVEKTKHAIEQEHIQLGLAVQSIKAELIHLQERVAPISQHSEATKEKNETIIGEMEQLRGNINDINAAVDDIRNSTNEIGKGIERYNKIIKDIKDIAEQTNILAINASIEAANIGAAGKGFAVVAGEVRDLAIRSNETVKRAEAHTNAIAADLEAINKYVNGIVERVSATENTADVTLCSVNEMNQSTENINASVQEVSGIVEDINTSVSNIV